MPDKTPPTLALALQQATKKLQPARILCASDRDVGRLEAEVLLAHVLKKDRTWLLAHDDATMTVRQRRLFDALVKRRLKHEPIAYILGYKEFYGRPFIVNRHVLIPRPESELLVELALAAYPHKKNDLTIWDIGTGSGVLAITLALELPRARVIGTDVSRSALTLARANARKLGTKNVTFMRIVEPPFIPPYKGNDHAPLIIVANLPYLPDSDKTELDHDVIKYEPHGALFGGPDGLDIIRALLDQIKATNVNFDVLLLECDPRNAQKLKHAALARFPEADVTMHRDLAGRMRVINLITLSPNTILAATSEFRL